MIQIDLITGFLGAGKTTFLKMYAKKCINQGEKISIIENDFGAINVDMVMLQELAGDNCNLEMIVGGDGREAHKRRLKTKLISMGMQGFNRVIIEPSGIFDLDEFFDVLYEEPLDRWYEIGNVISIVDGELEDNISAESQYLLMSEAASAGIIVISKIEGSNDPNVKRIVNILQEVMQKFGCSRKVSENDFISKRWEELTEEDFGRIVKCGFNKSSYPKIQLSETEGYQTIFYFDYEMPEKKLVEIIQEIFKDKNCGNIIRIKGFVSSDTNDQYEVNATSQNISTRAVNTERAVLIVIGEKLNREKLAKYLGSPSI